MKDTAFEIQYATADNYNNSTCTHVYIFYTYRYFDFIYMLYSFLTVCQVLYDFSQYSKSVRPTIVSIYELISYSLLINNSFCDKNKKTSNFFDNSSIFVDRAHTSGL